jgi:hypothetical protein
LNKQTTKFCYLRSIVRCDGGCYDDIKDRINTAKAAFNNLLPVWNSKKLKLRTAIRMFNSSVKSVLLHASESWLVSRKATTQLQTFINRCLRRILQVRWPELLRTKSMEENARSPSRRNQTTKMGRAGAHTAEATHQCKSNGWNSQGSRRRGRPHSTWRRSFLMEIKAVGLNWNEVKMAAENKVRWRCVVDALCSK